MKLIHIAALISALFVSSLAGEDVDDPVKRPLRLDMFKPLTDSTGHVIVSSILQLRVGDFICMHLPSGKELNGRVYRREETPGESIKVYGELHGGESSGFGVIITAKGVIAGAVLFRESNRTFVIDYIQSAKAYMFIPTTLAPKEGI